MAAKSSTAGRGGAAVSGMVRQLTGPPGPPAGMSRGGRHHNAGARTLAAIAAATKATTGCGTWQPFIENILTTPARTQQ